MLLPFNGGNSSKENAVFSYERIKSITAIFCVLLSYFLCCFYHSRQRCTSFTPSTGFQSTVWIDPQSADMNIRSSLVQQLYHLSHTGHSGGMDIIYSRTNFVWIFKSLEYIQ